MDFNNRFKDLVATVSRKSYDVYSRVQRESAMFGFKDTDNIKLVIRKMREEFKQRGIVGFVDRAGRQWHMDNYTDMAARTVTAQARIRATEMEFLAHGQNLVRISSHLPTCPLCAPWNGVIVALAEPTEEYPHTLDEARAAGLFHSRCLHSISLVAPGFSEPGPSEPDYSEEAKRRNEEAREEARRTPEVAKRLDPRLKLLTASNVTGIIEKLTSYSLVPDHKVGGNKAIVFESALGYNLDNAKELQSAILSGLANADKYYKGKNEYGVMFNAVMTIKGPNGQQARVVTGWILEGDSRKPRMTTAYIEKRKKGGNRNEGK